MVAYYNEIDPFAAQWLRNLIAAGHIAPGDVDERDIRDVRPDELKRYRQCHFFAGISVWSHALRMAGWRDDAEVWTGSCPCQPFSQAGAGEGFADERHLWPHFHWLIGQRRPAKVFGEQVASKDGLAWIDLVQADMEAARYAFGKADLCAAGFGAPHIRQRLYWVGDASGEGRRSERKDSNAADGTKEIRAGPAQSGRDGTVHLVVDADHEGLEGRRRVPERADQFVVGPRGVVGELADDDRSGRAPRGEGCAPVGYGTTVGADRGIDEHGSAGPTNGFWRAADWLLCRDGKWRPVEPGTFPLVNGASGRVGRLRAYGNAIVAEQAIGFIEACLETVDLNVEK